MKMVKIFLFKRTMAAGALLSLVSAAIASSFILPIAPSGADPWVLQKDGYYYYIRSSGGGLWVSKCQRLQDIGQVDAVKVWHPSPDTMYSQELWAPELHWLDGKCYIYVAASDGDNNNHRMFVLESKTDDPQGAYIFKGKITDATDCWAIDGTVLETEDGSRYFIWSGWEGDANGMQRIYIAQMSNPWTIGGPRVELSRPTESWERVGRVKVNEGPQILKKYGVIHIVYSASGFWTDDYCLGRLTNTDGDVMNPDSWQKVGPLFSKTERAYAPGHASFTKSPDGREDWIVYHARLESGHTDRDVRMQRFGWKGNNPDFGRPQPVGRYLEEPSGSIKSVRYEAEDAVHNGGETIDVNASGKRLVKKLDKSSSRVRFTVYAPRAGHFLMKVFYANEMPARRSHAINVNGEADGSLGYRPFVGEGIFSVSRYVHLRAGKNTIEFSYKEGSVVLDCIEFVF